ncbi:hypothetical protein [Acaryochloris marina]|uniref:Uncharacterized protein n=1 Tax=Acaryochloris marina (strain MBIC 11017) TaxID=329726 RepID=A8ZMD7_ACAM1|nr:hypothetical protein [Acaryochloris marina]ABW32348.1 hypothetical protein AM1_C0038 [Acaryochloris marina MBIC11017]
MQVAIAKIGDATLLVTPDGKPVPHKDTEQPTFHIQPQLFNPYCDIGLSDISLVGATIAPHDSTKPVSVLPKDVTIRQPYPNENYYVAGMAERKMGWDIPLDLDAAPKWLDLTWEVRTPSDIEHSILTIYHRFTLEFILTQQGQVFSMDQANTFYDPNARTISHISLNHIDDSFTKGDKSFKSYRMDSPHGLAFYQTLILNSCAWSDLICTAQEDVTLLRDIEPAQSFQTHIDLHRQNACIEIPADVLHQAICDTQVEVDFEIGEYDRSPGLQRLCRWWNENAPVVGTRRAAFIALWCRVEDDDWYWSGWDECPEWGVENIQRYGLQDRCARWNDFVILEFFPRQVSRLEVAQGASTEILGVDGKGYTDTGLAREDVDEAYHAHYSLQAFPKRFPFAWKTLQAAVHTPA